jgi:hypothetical protein
MFDLKPEQIVAPAIVREDLEHFAGHVEIYISIDWGYKPSYHAAHWHAIFPDHRVITFMELYGQELVFEEFVEEIRKKSENFYISATCLPHDMFREGDRYRDDKGKIIGETKADVFEAAGLNPISVASGKGKVQMRFDKIHSAMTLTNTDGVYKFRISKACPNLIDELEHAVHSDIDPTQMAHSCKDHAIDDYGLFLVYYSDDIDICDEEIPAWTPQALLKYIKKYNRNVYFKLEWPFDEWTLTLKFWDSTTVIRKADLFEALVEGITWLAHGKKLEPEK